MATMIRTNAIHTIRVKPIPDHMTVEALQEALALFGDWDYDYLHMPIHNKTYGPRICVLQGFACINFPVVEDAAAFCLAVWGHHFGVSCPAKIDISAYQGLEQNLEALCSSNWDRRMRVMELAASMGSTGHGQVHVRIDGYMQPITNKEQAEEIMRRVLKDDTGSLRA